MILRTALLIVLCFAAGVSGMAQESGASIDRSALPSSASDMKAFVPRGWKIEEQLKADLNGDSSEDYVLKLVEDKPAKDKDDMAIDRNRALVIVFQDPGGKLSLAAVNDKLLQCTTCGGAFYGVSEAPADVKIEKGVIVIEQDHGSRWVSDLTFRFRYEAASQKFLLIGFDYMTNDRLERNTVTESTNYLTGLRVVTRTRAKETTVRTQIPKKRIYLEDVDSGEFEQDVSTRLGV